MGASVDGRTPESRRQRHAAVHEGELVECRFVKASRGKTSSKARQLGRRRERAVEPSPTRVELSRGFACALFPSTQRKDGLVSLRSADLFKTLLHPRTVVGFELKREH